MKLETTNANKPLRRVNSINQLTTHHYPHHLTPPITEVCRSSLVELINCWSRDSGNGRGQPVIGRYVDIFSMTLRHPRVILPNTILYLLSPSHYLL